MKRIEKMNIPDQLVQKLIRMQILYDNELHERLLTAKIKSQLTEAEVRTLCAALEAEGLSVLDIGVNLAFDAQIFGAALTFDQLSSPAMYGELVIVEDCWDECESEEDVTCAKIYQVLETDEEGDVKLSGGASGGNYYIELDDLDDDGDEEFRIWAIKGMTKLPETLQAASADQSEPQPLVQIGSTERELVAAQPVELDPVDQAKKLHQRILDDAQSAAESLYDMCKAIKEMRDGKHYKALLYDNFEGYCEEALGMSRSHAYRYIQIAEGLSAENVASMRQIGATKLALLASVTEEQREEITQTVDLESTTVRELRAQVEAMKADAANKDKLLMQARESSQKSYEEVQERQEVINDLKARLKERTEQMNDMQAQITQLESRPVEVAVQDNSAELEQLRKEYEAKLAEQKKMMQELDDELGRKDDENYWSNVDRDLREVHSKIQSICVMVAGRLDCSEKETMKEKLRDLISDIEQRIGKE